MSTSPDGTFAQATYTSHRKLSMITNLLPEINSDGSSLDDVMDPFNNSNPNAKSNIKQVQDKSEQHTKPLKMIAGTQMKCDSQSQRDGRSMTLNDLIVCNNNIENKKLNSMNNSRKAGGYLMAVHRKLSRQDTYFLSYHKNSVNLFGVPLLIPCYEDGTNKDLYCAVWIQVARLLSPLPSASDQANHATDW